MNKIVFDLQRFDKITNKLSNTLVSGTAGDDVIQSNDGTTLISNVTIDAGAGNDRISDNFSENVVIIAGKGNDTVFSSGKNVSIDAGAGNDVISGDAPNIKIR